MATIAAAPFVLKDCALTIGADNYESSVSTVRFDPANTSVSWQGMTPSAGFTDTSSSTWTCTITFAQDWKTANSLSQYLMANEGSSVTAKFTPKKGTVGSTPQVTATLTIVPGSIGGDVNTFATATVTLGVSGKPTVALV